MFGSKFVLRLPLALHVDAGCRWNLWQPGLAIVDFTNPAACEWYKGKLRTLLDLGVDAFKVCLELCCLGLKQTVRL